MAGFLTRAFGTADAATPREQMKEAVAYFVVLMIYADGSVEDEEVVAARSSLARCRLFSDNTTDEDFKLLQKMERKMNQDAEGNADKYSSVLERENWKYTAAAIMADIMLADGDADEDELALLEQLSGRVGIESEELVAITATVRALRRQWRE